MAHDVPQDADRPDRDPREVSADPGFARGLKVVKEVEDSAWRRFAWIVLKILSKVVVLFLSTECE